MSAKSTKEFSPKEFAEFLVNQTPVFDQEILRDIRPTDGWLYDVTYNTPQDQWFSTREAVRRIVEGDRYKPSRRPRPAAMGEPFHLSSKLFGE